jgi:hypothetical protein
MRTADAWVLAALLLATATSALTDGGSAPVPKKRFRRKLKSNSVPVSLEGFSSL